MTARTVATAVLCAAVPVAAGVVGTLRRRRGRRLDADTTAAVVAAAVAVDGSPTSGCG